MSEGQLDGQTEGTGAISGYPATQSMTQVWGPGLVRGLELRRGGEAEPVRSGRGWRWRGGVVLSPSTRFSLSGRFSLLPPRDRSFRVAQWEAPDRHWTLFYCSPPQAVIQGAFTSDDAVDTEGTAAETHYTYFPSTAVGDGAGGTTSGSTAAVVTTQGSEALLGQATPPGTGELRGVADRRGWNQGWAFPGAP